MEAGILLNASLNDHDNRDPFRAPIKEAIGNTGDL